MIARSGALAVCTGCYGSTEPATEVGGDSARLNGQGTANNGPAFSRFKYRAFLGPEMATGYREWPAGASGPFSERILGPAGGHPLLVELLRARSKCRGGLRSDRDSRPADPMAGTRSRGTGGTGRAPAHPPARSMRERSVGERRDGEAELLNPETVSSTTFNRTFTGLGTCVAVDGNRATVGRSATRARDGDATRQGPVRRRGPESASKCAMTSFGDHC